jgi:hypothetical protein
MIQKPITTANGPAAFHVLKKIESLRPFAVLTLTVDSYADEATYLAGGGLITRHTVPMLSPTTEGRIDGDAEAWLIADASSPIYGGQIVPDASESIEALRTRKAVEMSQRCADTILAGFVSSALGSAYTYPAKLNDQANLTASVLASVLPSSGPDWSTPFWCADVDGKWEFRMHTAAQIQQVGVDAKVAILTCMTINEQLQAQIIAAETTADLAEITWPA